MPWLPLHSVEPLSNSIFTIHMTWDPTFNLTISSHLKLPFKYNNSVWICSLVNCLRFNNSAAVISKSTWYFRLNSCSAVCSLFISVVFTWSTLFRVGNNLVGRTTQLSDICRPTLFSKASFEDRFNLPSRIWLSIFW